MLPNLILGGYVAVTLGAFLEGETVLMAAGSLSRQGTLSFPLVVLAGSIGSSAWSEAWFYGGRTLARSGVGRPSRTLERARRAERWLLRYGAFFVLGFRFVAGLGTVSPVLLGATGYSRARFALLDTLSACAWALTFGSLGWGIAAGLGRYLGHGLPVLQLLLAVGFVAALLLLLGRALRARGHAREPAVAPGDQLGG